MRVIGLAACGAWARPGMRSPVDGARPFRLEHAALAGVHPGEWFPGRRSGSPVTVSDGEPFADPALGAVQKGLSGVERVAGAPAGRWLRPAVPPAVDGGTRRTLFA